MQLTKAEESIIQTIAEREGIAPKVMEATYRYYQQTGIPPHQNAPQWMKDIYREAQERKHYHREEE